MTFETSSDQKWSDVLFKGRSVTCRNSFSQVSCSKDSDPKDREHLSVMHESLRRDGQRILPVSAEHVRGFAASEQLSGGSA